MSTPPNKELSLEDRVKDLEFVCDSLSQQLQHTQRALFLIVSGGMGGRLPMPPEALKDTLQPMAIPCGFLVKMQDGPRAGASKIITANGRIPTN